MDKIIQVTENDIKNGIASNCYECPMVLAIQRRINKGVSVSVGRLAGELELSWYSPKASRSYMSRQELPYEAHEWYIKFDEASESERLTLKRIRFTLDIPEWALD